MNYNVKYNYIFNESLYFKICKIEKEYKEEHERIYYMFIISFFFSIESYIFKYISGFNSSFFIKIY